MLRHRYALPVVSVIILFSFLVGLSRTTKAQEWAVVRPQGVLRVADFNFPNGSVMWNYGEGLLTLDKDNNWIPCLAQDWRWVNDRTIEFMLRQGVTFHNGERFDAEAVKMNYEAYRRMKSPRLVTCTALVDDTEFRVIDDYTVRFSFPKPEGLAFTKFAWFFQFAPSFLRKHTFPENNWGELPEAGPWATGAFKLAEGGIQIGKVTKKLVLEAYERYSDRRYPKVKRIIFDNTLTADREETMRLCRETEGNVDIVTFIRPLDTLKVAGSPFAKIVKSRDLAYLWGITNQRKKGSRWKDIRLRKALNCAINRKELLKYAAKGNAYNLECFLPRPGDFGFAPSMAPLTYDTSKAKSLLAEAGYPNGFEMTLITHEAWKLEAKIVCSMLERVGLKATPVISTYPEFLRKVYIPLLEKSPEEQEWDVFLVFNANWFGHIGSSFLTYGYLEESDFRWIEYDPKYEKMWNEMAHSADPTVQETKIQQIVKYLRDCAYQFTIYSPLSLYAVNKEVNFVPQKFYWLRLKETSISENHWSLRGKNN